MTGAFEFHGGFLEKLIRQVKDVVSVSERRQGDSELVQTVIKIRPEPARPHLFLQGNIRGGDDSDIRKHRLGAAQRLDLSFLQHAQELCLHRERQVDNFIEEHSSALGKPEVPRLSLKRPGERALFKAEELRLD